MHDLVPTLSCGRPDQDSRSDVERLEVDVRSVDDTKLAFKDFTEESHTCNGEGEDNQHVEEADVGDVIQG